MAEGREAGEGRTSARFRRAEGYLSERGDGGREAAADAGECQAVRMTGAI